MPPNHHRAPPVLYIENSIWAKKLFFIDGPAWLFDLASETKCGWAEHCCYLLYEASYLLYFMLDR